LPGYTPHGRSYRLFNFETNTVVESCDVTFDETAPCPRDIFECASDTKMEGSMFVDEELWASTMMKMNNYFHLHHHLSLFLLRHLKQRLLMLLPLPPLCFAPRPSAPFTGEPPTRSLPATPRAPRRQGAPSRPLHHVNNHLSKPSQPFPFGQKPPSSTTLHSEPHRSISPQANPLP
jgi:hypothetical protein